MADDMNKKSSPANTAASIFKGVDYYNIPQDILRNIARTGQATQEHANIASEIARRQQSPMYQLGQKFPGQFEGTEIGRAIDKAVNGVSSLIGRQDVIEQGQRSRGMNTNESFITRHFDPSHIRGESERRMNDPEIQRRMLTQASSISPYQVHSAMNASDTRIAGYKTELLDLNKKLFDAGGAASPEHQARMDVVFGKRNEELNNKAILSGISKNYKAMGLDPLAETMGHLKMQSQAENVIARGGAGFKEAEIFIENLKKMNAETDKTSEKFKTLNEAVTQSGGDFMRGSGGGGGGKFLGMGMKGWATVGAVGFIASTVGAGIMEAGVDHRIADRGNIANMAGLENSRYNMYKAARGGDVASQIAMGNWSAAQRFGTQIKHTSQTGEAAQVGGNFAMGLAKTAGAGLMAGAGIVAGASVAGLPVAIALESGAIGLGVSAAKDFGVGASSLSRGIKSGQNYVAGVNSDMEARKAVNAIPAAQMQGLRDFYVGAGTVSMGMGGARGNAFLNEATGPDLLKKMAGAGISPEQMVQMADLGNKTVGSQFSTGQVFAMRGYEKAGLGTMQENMQRAGQLASAGSNNPQAGLEAVMSSAMTKGMDNSKALSMMVDNTAAMVTQSGNMVAGVDTTAIVTAQLASFADPSATNKEFEITKARSALEISRRSETNVSATFSGFVNSARVSAATGLSGDEAITAGKQDAAYWLKLRSEPNTAGATMRSMGMDVKDEDSKKVVDAMIRLSGRKVAEASGVANALTGGVSEQLMTALLGDPLKPGTREYKEAANIAAHSDYKTVERYQAAVLATQQVADLNTVPGGEGKDKAKTLQEQMDFLRTDGFASLSEAAVQASTQLAKLGGAMANFMEMQKEQSDKGQEKEGEASTAGAKAGGEFKMGVDKFGQHITRLGAILDRRIDVNTGIWTEPPTQQNMSTPTGRGEH